MTREEAIAFFKDMNECTYGNLEAVEMAIQALSQEPCGDEYIKVPKKALKYRTAGMVAYNAEWLKNHFDIERTVICGAQQSCDDAISREAVLLFIEKVKESGIANYGSLLDIATEVRNLPSVTPSCDKCAMNGSGSKYCDNCGQKYGKWTLMYEPKNMVVCSECGKCAYMYQDKTSAFCPHCGAKMQESEDK